MTKNESVASEESSVARHGVNFKSEQNIRAKLPCNFNKKLSWCLAQWLKFDILGVCSRLLL